MATNAAIAESTGFQLIAGEMWYSVEKSMACRLEWKCGLLILLKLFWLLFHSLLVSLHWRASVFSIMGTCFHIFSHASIVGIELKKEMWPRVVWTKLVLIVSNNFWQGIFRIIWCYDCIFAGKMLTFICDWSGRLGLATAASHSWTLWCYIYCTVVALCQHYNGHYSITLCTNALLAALISNDIFLCMSRLLWSESLCHIFFVP